MFDRRVLVRSATLLLMGISTTAMAACGSSDSGSSTAAPAAQSSSTTQGAGTDASVLAELNKGWKGDIQPPPSTGPKAVRGKTVWVTAAVGFEANKVLADSFTEAAKVLGWNVKVTDNKGDPSTAITQIKQAVSAGADGIVEMPFDCPVVKAGLLAAKQAKIPVVNFAGLDCDFAKFGGGEPLFAAPLKLFGTNDFAEYYKVLGDRDADFMLALLASKGVKNPKIIQTQNLDLTLNATMAKEFEARVKAKCPNCTVYPLKFTLAQVAGGKAAQIFKSGLLAHPDANALHFAWDTQLTAGGLGTAIKTASQSWKVICCGDGTSPGVKLARGQDADEIAINKYPYEWYSWGVADLLNRVFAGKAADSPNEGTMIFYVDKQHGLPTSGNTVQYPFDYKAAYTKVWTGQ